MSELCDAKLKRDNSQWCRLERGHEGSHAWTLFAPFVNPECDEILDGGMRCRRPAGHSGGHYFALFKPFGGDQNPRCLAELPVELL